MDDFSFHFADSFNSIHAPVPGGLDDGGDSRCLPFYFVAWRRRHLQRGILLVDPERRRAWLLSLLSLH